MSNIENKSKTSKAEKKSRHGKGETDKKNNKVVVIELLFFPLHCESKEKMVEEVSWKRIRHLERDDTLTIV